LVHANDDGPVIGALGAREEIDSFGDDGSERGLIVFEVAANGPFPVDRGRVGQGRVFVPIEGAHDGLADFLFEQTFDFFDYGADDDARGFLGAFGNAAFEGHQGADELRVGLDVFEQLGLEEELGQPFFLDGVILDDGDDVFFEVGADVAEPFGQIGSGGAKTCGTLATAPALGAFAAGFVVDGSEGFIHAGLFRGEFAAAGASHFGEGFLGVLAEDETPAF